MSHREKIQFNSIERNVKAQSFAEALTKIAAIVSKKTGQDFDILRHRLMVKEKTDPSGIGQGVAIQHLQDASITRPFTMMMTLEKSVSAKAVDDVPVDVVCFLMSPEKDGSQHLRRLSRFTRIMRDREMISAIRSANDDADIQDMVLDSQRQILMAA